MHYNDRDYWRHLQLLPQGHPDLPSPRVCRLLLDLFERWQEKPAWPGRMAGLLDVHPEAAELPVIRRKAKAMTLLLERICEPESAAEAHSFQVRRDELVVGTLPPFSVGQGKEMVSYLTDAERLQFMLSLLNERSPMGHIVPDHQAVIDKGLNALIAECEENRKALDGDDEATKRSSDFYLAAAESLKSIVDYAQRFAAEARRVAASLPEDEDHAANRESLEQVAKRLDRVPGEKPATFAEGVQAIYIVHCALHWTGEIVPLGRLDQLLGKLYADDLEAERITQEQAQELIDCLWVKLDEKVILHRQFAENRFSACDGVMTGSMGAANFDQGALLNQWMQQVTVGGVLADDEEEWTDATNPVTLMCLAAARRLPLNSPTLDLRVHKNSPPEVLTLAAEAILSGGAHPVLLNDDRLIPALQDKTGGTVAAHSARNYACDGCYETLFAGETEFSFGFVSALDLIEKSLNQGVKVAGAGPTNLSGLKDSWRTRSVTEIADVEALLALVREHMTLECHR
ncbi:pyruvate formate lyase family protein, partial [Planctomycetota bacterium]|nr:pyruvate formate lyase family protein [Planctomycetota bacterium]